MDFKVSPINFDGIDLGTGQPTYERMETVHVSFSGNELLTNYAKAFVAEAERKQPLRATKVQLTVEEVDNYCQFFIQQRVLCVKDDCKLWRKLKVLYIPAFVQHCISQIGRVIDRQVGLTIVPEIDGEFITYDEAVLISEKIAAFEDSLAMVKDAMPRGRDGDIDLMSTALIADAVRSYRVLKNVSHSYIAAFLNAKLREEQAMSALYRIRYDDVEYIYQALMTARVV